MNPSKETIWRVAGTLLREEHDRLVKFADGIAGTASLDNDRSATALLLVRLHEAAARLCPERALATEELRLYVRCVRDARVEERRGFGGNSRMCREDAVAAWRRRLALEDRMRRLGWIE